MEKEHYYHMFANGDDAKNFITNESEFKAAFNRFALCQYLTGAVVVSLSVEDTHPHALLWGDYECCRKFVDLFVDISIRSVVQKRGSADGMKLSCEMIQIDDELYLRNVGTYTITQATKDGKAVMPYDYLYGTGALYFRSRNVILPWLIDDSGHLREPVKMGSLTVREQRILSGSRRCLPPDYLVCNGFVLPTNYVDVRRFESIYKTHNCFRVFMASGKARDEEILRRMSEWRGVVIEDMQARALCRESCLKLFGKQTTRHLTTTERISLSQYLRKLYKISFRQLSSLVGIPESELRKYVK